MWLHVPSIPSRSAQESECSTLGLNLDSQTLEMFAQSCTSSGKHMRLTYWSKEFAKNSFPTLRCGLTSPQSDMAKSATSWIMGLQSTSCSAESLVSLGAQPESSRARPMSVTCGPMSEILSMLVVPAGFSSKTSEGSLFTTDSDELPQTFNRWATKWRLSCSEVAMSVATITGNACLPWPTPTVSSGAQVSTARTPRQTGGTTLGGAVKEFMLHFLRHTDEMQANGPMSLSDFRTCRLLLNPTFAEWLMGWPPFWTLQWTGGRNVSSVLETEWTLSVRLWRSATYSELLRLTEEPMGQARGRAPST